VARLGLHNVHFLTDVSEAQKAWLLANCKAFLFPSLLEGFGLPPIEAMYFGKPVVVARRTSLPEVCGSEAGYFDSFEPGVMKSTVIFYWMEIDKATNSKSVASERALTFNWNAAGQKYITRYKS